MRLGAVPSMLTARPRPRHAVAATCLVLALAVAHAQSPPAPVPAVGIDLGTTMTVVARYYLMGDATQGEVFINEQGGHKIVSFKILPQVVYEKCPRIGKPKHRIGGGSNIDVEAQTRYAIPIDTILQNRPNLEYHSLVYHLDEQNHVPIKRLYPYIKPPWRVKVRILRIGEPRTWNNEKGSGSLINLDLVNGEGTEVQCTVFTKQIPMIEHIKVGSVYLLSNCVVKPLREGVRGKGDMCLVIDRDTKI